MNIFKDVAARKYKFAIWAMALGMMGACLSIVAPGLLGLALGVMALIFAIVAKRDYYTLETSTASTIGLLTGIVATVLSGIVVIVPIIIIILAFAVVLISIIATILPRLLSSLF